jgi:sphinganine-1-phosphate aldolase
MSRFRMPAEGDNWIDLRREIYGPKAADVDWTHGAFYYHWPEPGGDVHATAMSVSNLFFNDQWLGKYNQPSFNRLLAEIEGMVLDILEAPEGAHCCLTTGGTESILLAMKTARDWAAAERPDRVKPEILLPYSAHPAFNKAAALMGIKAVRVPQGADWRADVGAMRRAITPQTIAVVGSAPSWPHGLIDPIPAIAALAREHGLWCHVDGCIGGFLLPFYRAAGESVPPWQLAIEGVCSISADLHKFGFTPVGMSSLVLKSAEHRKYLQFSFGGWPCGTYTTECLVGTRPARAAAAAWATMRRLGRNGYVELARHTLATTKRLVEGLGAIGHVQPLARPEAGVLLVTSPAIDIFAVSVGLKQRGFPHGRVVEPEGLHFTMNPVVENGPVDALLAAMAASVEDVRAGKTTRQSSEASYV